MMYYIEKPQTYSPVNRKCREVLEFIEKFENCLITDDISLDALIEEIRHKLDELNEAYPRTKRLVIRGDKRRLDCCPEGRECNCEYVFLMNFHPVRRTYRFAEQAAVLKEGGQQ